MNKKNPPRLVFTANLWTLVQHPSPNREWSLARKVEAVAEAGFEAITTIGRAELQPLLARHKLRLLGFFSSSQPREFRKLVQAQKDFGAEGINVHLGDESTPVEQSAPMALALLREGERAGIYTAIEAHRDTATETPEKLFAIADAYRKSTGKLLPITWDHSHLAVVKHLRPEQFSAVLLKRRDLIQAARYFHCRPFNGHHCQVPVFDASQRLTPEFKAYLSFAEDLFACWLAGPRPGNEIWVCPELGPVAVHGYNLSTMPGSWRQALVCKRELGKIWRRLVGPAAA